MASGIPEVLRHFGFCGFVIDQYGCLLPLSAAHPRGAVRLIPCRVLAICVASLTAPSPGLPGRYPPSLLAKRPVAMKKGQKSSCHPAVQHLQVERLATRFPPVSWLAVGHAVLAVLSFRGTGKNVSEIAAAGAAGRPQMIAVLGRQPGILPADSIV